MSHSEVEFTPVVDGAAQPMTFSAKVERNSRGVTWSIGVQNAPDIAALLDQLDELSSQMAVRYGKMVLDGSQ